MTDDVFAAKRQIPFDPRAGYLQAVPTIDPISCRGCRRTLPPTTGVCPVCGFERGLEGAPYPSKEVRRFSWVFAQRVKNASDKLVLLALVEHDMPGGRGIFPSIERLAAMTALDRATVIRALARLRKAGWVERRKARKRGRQGSNAYDVKQPEKTVAEHLRAQSGGARP